ncbi:MAG: hypothetical protein LDLANPLL_00917 [Turneriella sp.]|nr:hypothetical protein [Turneriella sp.]
MTASLYKVVRERSQGFGSSLPSKKEAGEFISALLEFLFARSYQTQKQTEHKWQKQLKKFQDRLFSLLVAFIEKEHARKISTAFFQDELPHLFEVMWQDAEAGYKGDPAAESVQEVILAYPGFYAVATYRIAHYLFTLKIPTLPRLLSEHAHEVTGIDIHPGAQIGKSFFMDHGTGIVIGGTTIIQDNVKIYQGVTLGALSVEKSLASTKRHPTIEEGVVIYAGATILGGNTVIGRNATIGGNTWLVESVPPYSIVYHKSEVKVRPSKELDGVIDFII